jgi:Tfp pilus assembly protein PilZ
VESSSSSSTGRSLLLVFESPEAFRAEYARNLSNGGAYVPCEEDFELFESVMLELHTAFTGETLSLAAEVVHSQPRAGVSVQLLDPRPELIALLEPILAQADALCAAIDPDLYTLEDLKPDGGEPLLALGDEGLGFLPDDEHGLVLGDPEEPAVPRPAAGDANGRTFIARADRWRSRVAVRVRAEDGSDLHARSRDLSVSGVLLSVDGAALPVGHVVRLAIVHPNNGDALEVGGTVVRHVEAEGFVAAVAIRFDVAEPSAPFEWFVTDVRRAHEARQRDGIHQALDPSGAAAALRLLAGVTARGTLTVIHGVEEGTIVFEAQRILAAELADRSGIDALAGILAWREGFLEFHAQVDGLPHPHPPLALEAAIVEALGRIDAARGSSV